MTNRSFVLLFCVLLLGSAKTFAQSPPSVEQLYGQGVHAFNSQRYAEAIGYFNQMESLGVQDPRAFFFRGLSHARMNNDAAAQTDYATAAKMELTVAGRSYSVPKALERIQGRERTVIEQYRRAAKRDWDAEENLRRLKDFELQRKANDEFYQTIMESGKLAAPSVKPDAFHSFEPVLSFGVQATTPFGVSRPGTVAGSTPSRSSEPNAFQEVLNQVPVIEQPEASRPTRTPRPEDPSATGIFDTLDDGNEIEGFDSSIFQSSSKTSASSSRSGGLLPGIADQFLTEENGATFGKGFASLFKKSGGASVPAVKPDSPPVTTLPNRQPPMGMVIDNDLESLETDPFDNSF